MESIRILEEPRGIVVISPYFSPNNGFIFPYGQFGNDISSEGDGCPSEEPELFNRASSRLESLGVKRPTLQELMGIYSFLTHIPDRRFYMHFRHLLMCYPVFAFNPFALDEKNDCIHTLDSTLENRLTFKIDDFREDMKPKNLGSSKVLRHLIGRRGMGELAQFLSVYARDRAIQGDVYRTRDVDPEELVKKCLSPDSERPWLVIDNDLDIRKIGVCFTSSFDESKLVKTGFPIVALECSGVDGAGNIDVEGHQIDTFNVLVDFWPKDSGAQEYGYSFGML